MKGNYLSDCFKEISLITEFESQSAIKEVVALIQSGMVHWAWCSYMRGKTEEELEAFFVRTISESGKPNEYME